MNTRRSFLKSLVGIVASVALAQRAVLDTLEIAAPEAVPNPAYENALYEEVIIGSKFFTQFFDAK